MPHSIAMDSQGRVFVGDRRKSRIQIFDQDGEFLTEWKQFGVAQRNLYRIRTMYVVDSEEPAQHPG